MFPTQTQQKAIDYFNAGREVAWIARVLGLKTSEVNQTIDSAKRRGLLKTESESLPGAPAAIVAKASAQPNPKSDPTAQLSPELEACRGLDTERGDRRTKAAKMLAAFEAGATHGQIAKVSRYTKNTVSNMISHARAWREGDKPVAQRHPAPNPLQTPPGDPDFAEVDEKPAEVAAPQKLPTRFIVKTAPEPVDFKRGDVVTLKSGGQACTVVDTFDDNGTPTVRACLIGAWGWETFEAPEWVFRHAP
ncbi:MAG: hypothetical protein AB7F96_22190 [Beijerinckiaceae bacterium]